MKDNSETGHTPSQSPVDKEPDKDPMLNVRERLRARRDELKKKDTLTLVVPGYEEELAVRYRAVPGKEMEKFSKKLRKTEAGMKTAEEIIVRCCETIMARPEEDADLEPLTGDKGDDDFVKFDVRLADFLGFDAKSVHEVIKGTFSPDDNRPLAAFGHAHALMSWMEGKEEQVDKNLLGE